MDQVPLDVILCVRGGGFVCDKSGAGEEIGIMWWRGRRLVVPVSGCTDECKCLVFYIVSRIPRIPVGGADLLEVDVRFEMGLSADIYKT